MPKADTLDFTGFRPLLTSLVAAINKHKAPAPDPTNGTLNDTMPGDRPAAVI